MIFFTSFAFAKKAIKGGIPLPEVKAQVKKICEAEKGVQLDYFEVADRENLNLLDDVKKPDQSIMLIAGYVGDVRLIDNMMID